MDDLETRKYQRLTAVETFGEDNAADFEAGSKAPGLFAKVSEHIATLDGAKSGQQTAKVNKMNLFRELREDFKAFNRTALTIEMDEPDFAAPYRTPRNLTMVSAITHADAMLRRLEDVTQNDPAKGIVADTPEVLAAKAALRARFIAEQMDEDFVEDLRDDRDALVQATKHNQGETQGGVESTSLIDATLKEAAQTVKRLNTLMLNQYARQPEKLSKWRTASHVARAPKRERTTTEPVTPA